MDSKLVEIIIVGCLVAALVFTALLIVVSK